MDNDEYFETHFWPLNEFGDYSAALSLATYISEREEKDRFGITMDIVFLAKKYQDYLAWWNHCFGDKDSRFIRSADQLRSIYDFLRESFYRKEWKVPPGSRDAYLFGGINKDILTKSLESFQNEITRSRDHKKTKKHTC